MVVQRVLESGDNVVHRVEQLLGKERAYSGRFIRVAEVGDALYLVKGDELLAVVVLTTYNRSLHARNRSFQNVKFSQLSQRNGRRVEVNITCHHLNVLLRFEHLVCEVKLRSVPYKSFKVLILALTLRKNLFKICRENLAAVDALRGHQRFKSIESVHYL